MFESEEELLGDVLQALAIYFAVVVVLIAPLVEANRRVQSVGYDQLTETDLLQYLSSEPIPFVLTSR